MGEHLISRRSLLSLPALLPAAALSLSRRAPAAVRGDEVMYVGGTMQHIPDKTEGKLALDAPTGAEFNCEKGRFTIPYKGITSLEYGQKSGRRIGVAIAISPIALLSKKRKHFLSIGFRDDKGVGQGAVFELSKNETRTVITTFEAKSGKKVEFESDDARKHYEKEAK
ncbi:MAG: hypothetical protein IPJ98_14205 [Bryobacterales bacterium]|nr:hypothetical protein [Bryobacterales bacterium]